MANFINKYQNQSAYEADSTKQYPNVSLVNGTVEYAATAPSYVFSTSSQTTQNVASDTTTVTLSVTSTKNGSAIGYTGSTNDAWITNISISGGTTTLTLSTNSGSARNGSVILTQNESSNTLSFTIAQAAPAVDDSNVTYVVNAPSTMTTKIFGIEDGTSDVINPSSYVDYIKVDGETVNLSTLYANDNDYQLTQGQHTIKYKFTEGYNGSYRIYGTYGIFKDTNDASIVSSITYEDGLYSWEYDNAQAIATTVILPSTCESYSSGDNGYIECTNLYMYASSEPVQVNCTNVVCVDCAEYDPEDPETCIECLEEDCMGWDVPIYTNLYVPSALVSDYDGTIWHDVNAIV